MTLFRVEGLEFERQRASLSALMDFIDEADRARNDRHAGEGERRHAAAWYWAAWFLVAREPHARTFVESLCAELARGCVE